jgi:hypothetical protein
MQLEKTEFTDPIMGFACNEKLIAITDHRNQGSNHNGH